MAVDLTAFGIVVGHATDEAGATGLTVVRGIDAPLRGSCCVFGRATGTRELETLRPGHLVNRVDALVLAGGSAYGLAAVDGAMRWLEERRRGFPVTGGVVPIVPAAVIFDLVPLGRFDARPTAEMAYRATEEASASEIPEGCVGVGTGATVGKVAGPRFAMKSGVGCSVESGASGSVAALVCVNALGDVLDGSGAILAGARRGGSFLDTRAAVVGTSSPVHHLGRPAGQNTTLAVLATDAPLSQFEHAQLARAAGAALFRRIAPAGTAFDGDVVFSLGRIAGDRDSAVSLEQQLSLEILAVRALERAIERSVLLALGRDSIPGLADTGRAPS